MSGRLRIAVAISTRDRAPALERCLASLAEGTRVPDEVVVADQSDGGETRAVVERAAGVPVSYVRARPGGLGAAQNDAVGATAAPVVAVLDDDCVADPSWLAVIEHGFDTEPELALLAGRVLPLGPPTATSYAVSSRTSTQRREFAGPAKPWDVGSGNNFAFRREWFDRIGGCDERLGPGAPLRGGLDMDLFHRLLRAGGHARYEPDALVLHERTTKAGRIARRSAYGFGMGAAISIWRGQGDPYAWRILGAWLGMRLIVLARAAAGARWQGVYEEMLVLGGTLQGLARGGLAAHEQGGRAAR